jgi:hypothetical protein
MPAGDAVVGCRVRTGDIETDDLKIRIEVAGRKLELETESERPHRDEAQQMARVAFGRLVR